MTFAVVVVVGVVIGLVLGPGGGDDPGGTTDRTGRIEPGTLEHLYPEPVPHGGRGDE